MNKNSLSNMFEFTSDAPTRDAVTEEHSTPIPRRFVFPKLSPEERRSQKIDWVWGQMPARRGLSREDVERQLEESGSL